MKNIPDPIFELGKVPFIPHCVLIARKYEKDKWVYAIQNNYNSYGSGWGDEDFIISQIENVKLTNL